MKYSIAMCTFNGEKYILEQLNSILSQTILPEQIVVIDDDSQDNTWLLINDFSRNNLNVGWNIEKNSFNLGYVKNYEKAIRKCSNDIIFLSDQDDIWKEDKAERIITEFNLHPQCSVIFSDALIVDEQLKSTGNTMFQKVGFSKIEQIHFHHDKYQMCLLLNRSICTGATMAFKKSFIEQFFPLPVSSEFIHDAWIATIAAYLGNLYFVNEPLTLYRQHEKQSIGTVIVEGVIAKSKIKTLLNHIQRSYNREKFVLEFIDQKSQLKHHKNYNFLKSRVSIHHKILSENDSFLKRFTKFSVTTFFKKLPEFNSIRKFVGNWIIYLFKIK